MKSAVTNAGCGCTRRAFMAGTALSGLGQAMPEAAAGEGHREFVLAAAVMREQAVKAGDQSYGAVIVRTGRIVGSGPSRVVAKGDPTAHAEREAIRDAQGRLGTSDLAGCVMYSTSRPCMDCERAAGRANIARMYHGPQPIDAGRPRAG